MIFKPQNTKSFTKLNPIQLYTMVEYIGNPKKKNFKKKKLKFYYFGNQQNLKNRKIGRASCRERV